MTGKETGSGLEAVMGDKPGQETGAGALPDLAELKRLAQAATPGPWLVEPDDAGRASLASVRSAFQSAHVLDNAHDDDAAFIAACSPDVVLGLLDSLRENEDLVEHLQDKRAQLTSLVEKQCAENERILAETERLVTEYTRLRDNRDEWRGLAGLRLGLANDVAEERDALRARIAELEAIERAQAEALQGVTDGAIRDFERIAELEAELARTCDRCQDRAAERRKERGEHVAVEPQESDLEHLRDLDEQQRVDARLDDKRGAND